MTWLTTKLRVLLTRHDVDDLSESFSSITTRSSSVSPITGGGIPPTKQVQAQRPQIYGPDPRARRSARAVHYTNEPSPIRYAPERSKSVRRPDQTYTSRTPMGPGNSFRERVDPRYPEEAGIMMPTPAFQRGTSERKNLRPHMKPALYQPPTQFGLQRGAPNTSRSRSPVQPPPTEYRPATRESERSLANIQRGAPNRQRARLDIQPPTRSSSNASSFANPPLQRGALNLPRPRPDVQPPRDYSYRPPTRESERSLASLQRGTPNQRRPRPDIQQPTAEYRPATRESERSFTSLQRGALNHSRPRPENTQADYNRPPTRESERSFASLQRGAPNRPRARPDVQPPPTEYSPSPSYRPSTRERENERSFSGFRHEPSDRRRLRRA